MEMLSTVSCSDHGAGTMVNKGSKVTVTSDAAFAFGYTQPESGWNPSQQTPASAGQMSGGSGGLTPGQQQLRSEIELGQSAMNSTYADPAAM